MDRNTFTGLFLILIILVGSTFLLKPSSEELKKKGMQDSIAVLKENSVSQNKVAQMPTATKADSTTLISDSSTTSNPESKNLSTFESRTKRFKFGNSALYFKSQKH